MNHLPSQFLLCNIHYNWSIITSIIAIVISIFAIVMSIRFARKTIRLSIHQSILKTISDKASDCNTKWVIEQTQNQKDLKHTEPIKELVITMEVLEKSIRLFAENDRSIRSYQKQYDCLLWKQLRTELRGFIVNDMKTIAEKDPVNQYYLDYYKSLDSIFKPCYEEKK